MMPPRTVYVSVEMKVMKLSTGSSFAIKTVLVNGLKQSSSALAFPPVWMVYLMAPGKSNTTALLDCKTVVRW